MFNQSSLRTSILHSPLSLTIRTSIALVIGSFSSLALCPAGQFTLFSVNESSCSFPTGRSPWAASSRSGSGAIASAVASSSSLSNLANARADAATDATVGDRESGSETFPSALLPSGGVTSTNLPPLPILLVLPSKRLSLPCLPGSAVDHADSVSLPPAAFAERRPLLRPPLRPRLVRLGLLVCGNSDGAQ